MKISYTSSQINKIVEAVLPVQKTSAALGDQLFTHTMTVFYMHYTQGSAGMKYAKVWLN